MDRSMPPIVFIYCSIMNESVLRIAIPISNKPFVNNIYVY